MPRGGELPMRRRMFFRFLAGLVVIVDPIAARAQATTATRRIGYLDPGAPETAEEIEQQYASLRKLGWVVGQNLTVERRYANGRVELLPALAEELVRLRVELILTSGTQATLAAKRATTKIPIVFWSAGDPVGAGLVDSLARPGGNVTGFTFAGPQVDSKRLQVLRELLPSVQRIGVLENASNPYNRAARADIDHAARSLGMQLNFVGVRAAGELASAVAEVTRRQGQALLVGPDELFYENRVELMQLALKQGLPTTVSRIYIRELGALISYANNEAEADARAASFVDRVLRGARPADLPVEQPTKFGLIINLKTAKALGITVQQSLLMRADELIQ